MKRGRSSAGPDVPSRYLAKHMHDVHAQSAGYSLATTAGCPSCGGLPFHLPSGRAASPSCRMLELFYDHNHHLLLGTFRSILTPGDLKLFDDTERRLVVEVGMRRGILDLAGVTAIAIPDTLLRLRGRTAQTAFGQQRAVVATRPDTYALARASADQQHHFEPFIVTSLDEALALLGVEAPHFHRVY